MDAQWLQDQFKSSPGKNKGDLSQALGVQASGISKMLAGTRQIKAKEYLLMRKFFGLPGSGQSLEKKRPDIQSYDTLHATDSASQNWKMKPEYEVVEVTDTMMVPDFIPGERVLIDTGAGLPQKAGVFAIEDQGRILIRYVEASAQKLKISANSKDADAKLVAKDKIRILGRVIAKLNWL